MLATVSSLSLGFSVPLAFSSLGISWVLSTISGYGIYGLQIVLQFLRQGGEEVVLTRFPAAINAPPLTQAKLVPILELARKLQTFCKEYPDEILKFKHPVLHGCSNDFASFRNHDKVKGRPNVACCAMEHIGLSAYGREAAKNYDIFIAISRWNEALLNSRNLQGPVHLCYQGVDGTLFSPGPRAGLYRDRFVVFSGGKFEFRKGQDIVLAAFKRFRARHPEALLVTCWQNVIAPDIAAFALAGHCRTLPQLVSNKGLRMMPWLVQQLPPGSFIDLGYTHNFLMPMVLRECDVAVFPNRSEGGTNLVAMEAMACGVPTYVAYNTGQKDLVDLIGCGAFRAQKPVKPSIAMGSVQDWGETEVDEVVAALEHVYSDREGAVAEAQRVAAAMREWDWGLLNEKLFAAIGTQIPSTV